MTSFLIGRVLEPELREVKTAKNGIVGVFSFAVLSGRSATSFDVWPDSKAYDAVCDLRDGQTICAIVGSSTDSNGKLRNYLNDVCICPDDLRVELQGLFKRS